MSVIFMIDNVTPYYHHEPSKERAHQSDENRTPQSKDLEAPLYLEV